ncbi:MAG: MMPL family transporter [Prevotella sp.]|jgi:predicted exporter
MTEFCIRVERFFSSHKAVYWTVLIGLFAFFGFFASKIQLEEDLSQLIPAAKNADGSTKLAFADLRIKDKTFLVFEGKKASTERIAEVCDAFVDSLVSLDHNQTVSDVFSSVPEETLYDAIDYLSVHVPNFIDTSCYAGFDTLLTASHMQRQMLQNSRDMESDFGQAYPELLQADPLGLRGVLRQQMGFMTKGNGAYHIKDGHFFVGDNTVCVAFLTPRYSAMDTGDGSRLFDEINQLIAQFQKTCPDVSVSYHGTPASGYYNSKVIKQDLLLTVGGSLCIVLLLISLCYRRFDTLPLLLLPVVFGALFALSMMYFIKGSFSLMALGMGAVILGVAFSYVLHVYTHSRYVSDMRQLLQEQVKPVCLGCITTVGAFLGLFFVKTELLRDFGCFAIFAILGTVAFTLFLLPPLLPLNKSGQPVRNFAWIERINNYPYHRNRWVMGIVCAFVILCVVAWLVKGTHFDSDMHSLGYKSPEVTHSESLLRSKTFTGDKERYFAASGNTIEEALTNFGHLSRQLDSLQRVGLVKSYTHTDQLLVPQQIQKERIEVWQNYWNDERLATARSLIAASAPAAGLNAEGFEPFFELATDSYEPDKLYNADWIPKGWLSTLIERSKSGQWLCFTQVRCENDTIHSRQSDYYRICDAVTQDSHQMVLDTYYYMIDTLEGLNSDFNILQWVSMLFVLLVLLLSCRFDVRATLVAFTPILLSWLVVLGVMAATGTSFNLVNIIISTFIFGMGVDYSIFVMSGLQSPQSEGDALLKRHKTAIFFSAAILIITVGSMLFATHPAIRGVGFATLTGLVSAVVLSYTVEPALYQQICKKK